MIGNDWFGGFMLWLIGFFNGQIAMLFMWLLKRGIIKKWMGKIQKRKLHRNMKKEKKDPYSTEPYDYELGD